MKFFKNKKAVQQFARFALVGIVSTILDIVLLNILSIWLGMSFILANIIATSIATVANYFAHERWTFRTEEDEERRNHLPAYLLVTFSSLYIVQSGVLWILEKKWSFPVLVLSDLALQQHIIKSVTTATTLNIAKLYALTIGAVWNFVLYRAFVFKPVASTKKETAF